MLFLKLHSGTQSVGEQAGQEVFRTGHHGEMFTDLLRCHAGLGTVVFPTLGRGEASLSTQHLIQERAR